MTRQTSIQLTPETKAQIEALGERGFGTQSNIIRTAIKRMYQQEIQPMTSQQTTEIAVKIARDVIDNGRVTASAEDKAAWLAELEVEVEAEARERGHDESEEIAAAATAYFA